MKVSHELPIDLLHLSKDVNDYEYCLPHLLDQSKDYLNHFLEAKEKGRYIIMDNSLHELGKAYGEDRLLYWVEKLQPNEFIVPDVWEDQTHTLVSAKKWSTIEFPKKWGVEKIAVVQAKNYSEAVECYSILHFHHGYKKIAFSYGANWYAEEFPHPNPLVGKMMGRIMTISRMYKNNIIEETDRIHLLGCALPQEFSYYKDFPFIESIDTSNPIIHALEGKLYNDFGLLEKSKTKIDTISNIKETPELLYNINHNLIKFKKFIQCN